MSNKFKLKRTIQCAKCPWKFNSNPNDIPGGYCETKHKNLEKSIAKEGDYDFDKPLVIMACHHSKENDMEHCVGWLHNQLGAGNNIMLRLKMRNCENLDLKVIGKQHNNFKDTLPK